jgi:hypothetical protein
MIILTTPDTLRVQCWEEDTVTSMKPSFGKGKNEDVHQSKAQSCSARWNDFLALDFDPWLAIWVTMGDSLLSVFFHGAYMEHTISMQLILKEQNPNSNELGNKTEREREINKRRK